MVHGFLLINFDTIFYVRYRSEEISPYKARDGFTGVNTTRQMYIGVRKRRPKDDDNSDFSSQLQIFLDNKSEKNSKMEDANGDKVIRYHGWLPATQALI